MIFVAYFRGFSHQIYLLKSFYIYYTTIIKFAQIICKVIPIVYTKNEV